MGSEGRSWSGAAAVGGGVEGEAAIAAVVAPAPGDVPASGASVDIALPLPEMTPRIMRVPLIPSLLSLRICFWDFVSFRFVLIDAFVSGWVRGICKELVSGWSSLDSSRFSIETVSGGITNMCESLPAPWQFHLSNFVVSAEYGKGNKSSVTVRLYGPNTDLVIDRKRELQAIPHLSAAGFGAQLLGTFENGMVQSFIYARTLTPSDMKEPRIAAEIAKELRRFHQVDIPGSKEPQLWDDIFKFMKKASILEFEDKEKQKRYETISFRKIQDEVKELKLYFIDFEYGSYSYRGYDIANHFNEYAGYDCDYSLYPDKDSQYHFFRNYLQPDRPSEVQVQDLDALYVETNTYRLASHIYWALWALIQAKVSPIDFDYLGYFFLRYDEYKKQRESCLSLAESSLSALKND
uniref:ethanolamine kinase n=1 Tax=Oryza meridionalis TaxID=40149 RepID=A0A0E0ESK9_9ORYZ